MRVCVWLCVKGEKKIAALKCIMSCSELYWGQQVMANNNGGSVYRQRYGNKQKGLGKEKKNNHIPQATVTCHFPTHTTSESSFTGFNSLNRRSGSLGICTEILRHVVNFLRRSFSLIEVDSLWSWWACESKTCTKTWLGVTHGWRHADVILSPPKWDLPRVKLLLSHWINEEMGDKKKKVFKKGRWMSIMTSRTLFASIIGFLLFLCTYMRH